jgi:hypothetical protein
MFGNSDENLGLPGGFGDSLSGLGGEHGADLGDDSGLPGGMAFDRPAETGKRAKKTTKAKRAPVEGAPVTKKALGRNRTLMLGLAGLVGVGILVLTVMPTTGATTWVALSKAGLGQTATLDPTQVLFQAVPDDLISEGALQGASKAEVTAKVTALSGKRVSVAVPARGQLHTDDFASAGLLSPDLKPGQVLMSISATLGSAVAGGIQAGDHVSVIGVQDGVARVLADDVAVLKVAPPEQTLTALANQQKDAKETIPAKALGGEYVVAVANTLAPQLVAVQSQGTLELVLRPQGAAPAPAGPVSSKDVICNGNLVLDGCR